jgi:uncharacterized protein with HEPN domain
MTRHDPTVYMRHMLDHAREAASLSESRTRADLDQDRLYGLAMARLIEVIGEASSRVPAETRSQYPQVPWADARRMRNRLIHDYDTVNYDIIWDTITNDLPPLIAALEAALPPLPE